MISSPNTMVRTGDRKTASSEPPGSRSTMSLSSSGTMVMKTAPRMEPRMEPMPPTMMAARKKMDIKRESSRA